MAGSTVSTVRLRTAIGSATTRRRIARSKVLLLTHSQRLTAKTLIKSSTQDFPNLPFPFQNVHNTNKTHHQSSTVSDTKTQIASLLKLVEG
ncbi:hypothetical protein LSTR_LSTR003193 [Laodelphax striatellus]|uniref:Uncharacterized protein n=1 Tax=Laodelphax striatellus TaxID=195883 RepID=A0A482XS34_LAOST|nr:hypothetical protein LSTR_LSTR016029 [Laodelphax striatellus]RZF48813.1 hypothetical protein LSTR_LSTR003193 [Laodelphax striatellus]